MVCKKCKQQLTSASGKHHKNDKKHLLLMFQVCLAQTKSYKERLNSAFNWIRHAFTPKKKQKKNLPYSYNSIAFVVD